MTLVFFTGVENLVFPFSYQLYQIGTIFQRKKLNLQVLRRFSSFAQFLFEKDGESLKIDLALDSPYRLAPTVESPDGILIKAQYGFQGGWWQVRY